MVSVIIPVYNEEKAIGRLLGSFSYNGQSEVIVVDGGSGDMTLEVAGRYPVKIVQHKKNRAAQMNRGAKEAKGDKFLFLHADCVLEEGALEDIANSSDEYVGGCLCQKIDSSGRIYRLIEASGNLRARIFKIFYGDQAIFVRKDIFSKIGGFGDAELFDDVIFSNELKKAGKTRVLNKRVYASPRRWQKNGVIKTTLINWLLSLGFMLGVSSYTLKKLYGDIR